jgi:capsular polysaccharide biosynthesis protein
MLQESKSRLRKAERIYRLLLNGYPDSFRSNYGEQMAQLFRDQRRDCEAGGCWVALRFWIHILTDAGLSITREHFHELERRMQMSIAVSSLFRWFPTTRRAFTAVFVVGTALSLLLVSMIPTTYVSTARVVIRRPNGEAVSETALRAELDRVASQQTMAAVVQSLQLTSRWAARYGIRGELSPEEAVSTLRRHTHVEPQRPHDKDGGARLISVRFYWGDRQEAAEIADAIAINYIKASAEIALSHVVEIADRAEPGLRPIRPNWPLGIVAGALISGAIAILFAFLLKLARPRMQAA